MASSPDTATPGIVDFRPHIPVSCGHEPEDFAITRTITVAAIVFCLVLPISLSAQLEVRLALTGLTNSDEFGAAVGVIGDLDGDGCSEVVAGAPFDDPIGISSGRARVFNGRTGAVMHDITGIAAGQLAGFGVSGAGDIDGDGTPDIMVGLSANGSSGVGIGGGVKIYSGATGALLRALGGTVLNDGFGIALKDAGDVDGDGHDDVIIGAPGGVGSFAGYARVFSGATGAMLFDFPGTATQERMGFAVCGGGDVTGDGVPDVAVGAIGRAAQGTQTGRVYVYSGANGALVHVIDGDQGGDQFGHSVDFVSDLDGDGRDEFVVGAYRPFGQGYCRVYSGATGMLIHSFLGASQEAFGHWVSTGGDMNGDGKDEIVVGAPEADPAGVTNAGRVLIYSGSDGALLRTFVGPGPNRRLGYSVSDAGDVNGDGFADAILGADVTGGIPGMAQVVSVAAGDAYAVDSMTTTQTLEIDWIPGLPGQVHQGLVAVAGASPLAFGAIVISTSPGASSVLGVDVHIGLSDILIANLGYDVGGTTHAFVNLRQPAFAGLALWLQAFSFDPSAPQGLYGSNGLGLLFTL